MSQDRPRHDAIRQRVFAQVNAVGSRSRIAWTVPILLVVLALLGKHGESVGRLSIQAAGTALVLGALLGGAWITRRARDRQPVALGWVLTLGTLAVVANTGGVTSPIGPLLLPAIIGTAMSIGGHPMRVVYVAWVSLSLSGMGLFAQTVAFGWRTSEYLALATVSSLYAANVVAGMGSAMACAYERVAMELAARREELCDESQDRSMALEGVAARLAHEVKNPLAAIKGLSAHLARSAADPRMAERLAIVASEADRLQAIVDSFLTFSRGLDDLRPVPARPFELARELALLLETRAAETGVSIDVRGDEGVTVRADPRKLRQLLLNLILNAMQASPAGTGIILEVWKTPEGGARVVLIDEGHGMTAEVLERIKKPYYSTREGGTGLGIAIARGLVEQHGGRLAFTSAPGRGTTATIELPATPACDHPGAALPNPGRPTSLRPDA